MTYQDVFRSGGGAHSIFVNQMTEHSHFWQRLFYRVSPYHRILPILEQRLMGDSGSRKIIAVCQQVKRDLMEAYGVAANKVVVIPNGVDHERFHPGKRLHQGKRIREELGIPLDGRVVIFVGTGFRRKGLDRLLPLWESGSMPGTYLLVVGNDTQLAHYRSQWNGSKVLFVGVQSRVEEYYAAADLLVLPSFQEAFGNVVLEALASGLPVITVAGVGAADELQGELADGILADPDDPEELRTKIDRFLFAEDWMELSREARRVAEGYTWDKYFERLEQQLEALRRH